jgi:hypothetical protein
MVLAALLRSGKSVLRPFGDNERYDLVIDDGEKFSRVQCKTARRVGNVLKFDTCSSYSHRGGKKKDYRGQVEFFGIYSPDVDRVFLVPVSHVGTTSASLRLTPTVNGQHVNVRLASDYELSFIPA